MRHRTERVLVTVLSVALLLAAPGVARAQVNPIDDLLKLATEAFNNLDYAKADSLARSVFAMNLSAAQRLRAQMVMAAAAYPEDVAAQRRPAALALLKQLVRANYQLTMPQELTWAGLDSLLAEAKRTTFAMQVVADSVQTVIGTEGVAKLRIVAPKAGFFRVTIMSRTAGGVAVVDSLRGTEGEIAFRHMRDEKPVFTSGTYQMIVTGYEPGARGDTVTVQYGLRVDAPPLAFLTVPTRMDSTKLLPERAGRMGSKAILPAIVVGGAAFVFSSVLRGEGDIATKVPGDPKGIAIGGALAASAIFAGFRDKGRLIPANISANRATGEAFQKSIVDANAENRKRIAEYKTVIVLEEAR